MNVCVGVRCGQLVGAASLILRGYLFCVKPEPARQLAKLVKHNGYSLVVGMPRTRLRTVNIRRLTRPRTSSKTPQQSPPQPRRSDCIPHAASLHNRASFRPPSAIRPCLPQGIPDDPTRRPTLSNEQRPSQPLLTWTETGEPKEWHRTPHAAEDSRPYAQVGISRVIGLNVVGTLPEPTRGILGEP